MGRDRTAIILAHLFLVAPTNYRAVFERRVRASAEERALGIQVLLDRLIAYPSSSAEPLCRS